MFSDSAKNKNQYVAYSFERAIIYEVLNAFPGVSLRTFRALAMVDPIEKRYLPTEAAKILGLNPDQVMTRVRSGKIRAINVASKGKYKCHWRIRHSDLEAYQAGTTEIPMHESCEYKPYPERYRTVGPVNEPHYTVKEVAETMRVSHGHVFDLIQSGCLLAVNVARPGAKRARWRIRESDWRMFEDMRLNKQWPKPKGGRRSKDPRFENLSVIRYY